MTTKALSTEISENITELKKLKEKNPSRLLSNRLQNMYDALHQAQGKEWEEQVNEYKKAKIALDKVVLPACLGPYRMTILPLKSHFSTSFCINL